MALDDYPVTSYFIQPFNDNRICINKDQLISAPAEKLSDK